LATAGRRTDGTEEIPTQNQKREKAIMVTVESIKPITNAGNLRAFAVFTIAGKLRISDVRVIQQQDKQPWVSMPSRAYEKDGQRKWSAIVELLDDKLKKEVSDAVLAEFDKCDAVPQEKAPMRW
jgi:DNA-binding cell septation regulator SpoVG